MWVPAVLFLIINIEYILCFENTNIKNEPLELTDLFLENLKADPLLLDDHEISENSKKFIDRKIEKFIELLWQSQNEVFSRTKRSLDDEISNTSRYSINITSDNIVPTEYPDDIRIINYDSVWYAVSLEDKNKLALFQYEDGNFKQIFKRGIEYTSNIAVISAEEFFLIVAGQKEKVLVFQCIPKKPELKIMQTLAVENPQHVALWEQHGIPYLSVTNNLENVTQSKIQIYTWLGRHFDLIQEIDLFSIKKTVPFNVHGSFFLAAVKFRPFAYQDGIRSYSEILRFDLHNSTFEAYQRVQTIGFTDIKYFTSELHGDIRHFLVVVHSTEKDFSGADISQSVIYKYEDQYFTPFQIIRTNAVQWQPIQDSRGDTALLALTQEGLKGFQYDGWHFSESDIISDDISLKFENITALHSYDFEKEQILVVACNHCKNTTNVFKITFSNFDTMKELHSQIFSWCTESLKDLESSEVADFVAESLRGDLNEQISLEEDQKRQLSAALTDSNDILINLEHLVDDSLQSNNVHVFDNDVQADSVIFNNEVMFKSLQTDWVNGVNIDQLLDNVLDISEGFVLDNPLKFDVIASKKALTPKTINGVPLESYIFVNDDVTLNNLVVNGAVTFGNGVNVQKLLNNMSVNEQSLLLKTGDQEFSGDMIIDDILVHNLTAANHHFDTVLIEKRDGTNVNDTAIHVDGYPISHIKNLKVKKLDIGGLLNGVSVPVLERHGLKKAGDQILEETLFVDSLNVERLNIGDKLSDKNIPDDFVLTNAGEYIVNQDVYFSKGLQVNKLEVLNKLNTITVTNEGELDILLIDSPKLQVIPTKKSFDNLIITNPITLRNKIKNAQMDRINPVMVDGESYTIDDDVTIEGLSEVRRWLKVADIKGLDGERSFRDVLDKGVKITDTQIPVFLNFTHPLDLDDTVADRVNFLNPHDWLLKTSDSPQIVKGQKNFLGDLQLEGPVNVFRLNDVYVQRLQKNVLRVEGDQKIEGLWEVDRVVAKQGIISNNTYVGETSWDPDSRIKQDTEEFSIMNSNVKVDFTKAKNLKVNGLINGFKISEIIGDIVRKNAGHKIFGHKIFDELHVDGLFIHEDETGLLKVLNDVMDGQVTLEKNIHLNNDINAENIKFNQKLNNITKDDFEGIMNFKSTNDDVTTVPSDRAYDQITISGEAFISDDVINGKNLSSIEKDTVKVDEDHTFDNVRFGEAILVQNSIQLEGNVENLDLNNIVQQNSDSTIVIQDKSFSNNVFVIGTLTVADTLNGFDLKKICEFSRPNGDLKTLTIEGDVVFVKGPRTLNINGLSVTDLMKNLWYVDKKANISGNVRLQNTTFNSSLNVEKFIDETNLKLLSQNYFSKSKNQNIPAEFSFGDVIFANISTPSMKIRGPINGIVIDDLLKTILLQNVTQIFESSPYFEEIRVQNLNEETTYSVNNLNLKTDVMRYDGTNTVTGRKIVNNLNTERIKINHNIKIQDVDVLEWLSNAILTNGSISVTGKKIFNNVTFKQGLSLRGHLNDFEFTDKTIMLVDTPQNITGKKHFISDETDPTKFKILRLKGLVNDMDFMGFVQNQTDKGQINILNSEIVFNNSVAVKNINIDVMYNDVNVSELLHNITKLGDLEHFQEKYENLLDMSLAVKNSVKDHASFFKYFKEILHLDDVYDIFGLQCKGGIFRLLAFSFINGTNTFYTYEWNIYRREFIYSGENLESYFLPNFMEQVSIAGNDYVYIEHPLAYSRDRTFGEPYFGQLFKLPNSTTLEPVAQFSTNGTKSLISFVPPGLNQPCLGFIDLEMSGMRIFCDESGYHIYNLFQTISVENIYMATTVRTQDSLYLFLARHGHHFKEPSIVVLESYFGSPEFREIQTIYEGTDFNGLTAAAIGNIPYVAFSFGPREAAIDSGRISIRRLDSSTHQFVQWQHIPVSAPLGVHFIAGTSFEPLLLAPSADASSPMQTLRYDGSAGFKKNLKGAALPPKSRIRVIKGGKFLIAMQDDRSTGMILKAVVKGLLKN